MGGVPQLSVIFKRYKQNVEKRSKISLLYNVYFSFMRKAAKRKEDRVSVYDDERREHRKIFIRDVYIRI